MATASILSRVTAPAAKPDITGASRDDLAISDVVELESVNTGTAYQWSIAFKPEGSAAVFSSTGTESAIVKDPGTFTVDVEGPYLIRLVFTDGTGTTEQYVRLRALTDFGQLKLVAAGERYDTLRVPVDAQPDGWADEQNYNLNALLGLVYGVTPSEASRTLYVDPAGDDTTGQPYQTIQAAMDYANTQTPSASAQWVVLVRPGTYVEDLTFYQWVHVFGWPGGEGTPLVTVQNDTAASHDITLPGPTSSLVLSNLRFERPATSANAVISQAALGSVQFLRCTLDGDGAGGAYASLGTVTFTDCEINGGGVAATDYALFFDGTALLDRCSVVGQSGLSVNTGSSEVVLRDSTLTASGTYAVNTVGERVLVEYSRVTGLIAGNPAASGAPADLAVDVLWSVVGDVSVDGTAVVGTASLRLGSSQHGTTTVLGGAVFGATVPADSVFYNNLVSGITAENVQDAIDEVYAYAALVRTLDDAYDGGVAASGSGRTIIADQGAVQIVDAPAPSDPIPPGNTNGNLEVVGSVSLGALTKPEITLDPNPFGNGPTVLLGREIWANDAPFGSTALVLGDASGNPTYHNYNLRVGTQSADGGNQVGSLYLRAGDSLTTIDAGSVFIQGGTATDAGGGTGGDIYVVPGETAAGGARSLVLVNPLTATPATLTAAGAFSGAAVAGDITIGSELGSVTVTFAGGEGLAAVHALFDATGVVTAAGDPIVLTSVAKGVTAEVFFISADAGVDASLGAFSGQAMVAGTWPDSTAIAATGTSEITFGAGNPNPMVYDSATGKLTVPGLIDPTGMVFDEAAQPATGANKGAIFVSDGSGGLVLNHLYYVNAAGTPTDITTGGGGSSVPTVKQAVTHTSVSPVVVTALSVGDVVVDVYLKVTTEFDGAAPEVTVGTTATPDLFMQAGDSDLTATNTYQVTPVEEIGAATNLEITLAGMGGATKGTALLVALIHRT